MRFVDQANDPGSYFWSIVEASQDCVRVLTKEGCVEYMNACGQALFEIDDFGRYQGLAWPDLWPDESRGTLELALKAALSGQVERFRAACPTALGHRKVWDTVVSPILAPDGTVVRLLATSRDVTAEVQTLAVRDAIIELLPAPLLVKDAEDGRYLVINRAAAEMLGRAAHDVIGRTAAELFSAEEARACALEDEA
ncbi:MAG: PAS domain-containing protein, partial [bacterium]|nr:PAS domain-containing protein [bacterium]